ncbi:histone-lysine N-methyltransferase SETMAR-like [Octopus bimaculoides]|uniref:histone-lysine N-methyltransferase SETMAR-like n=1 Tax=Octopus bimaculoides TaxID=37653 RepID=UPI00071D3D92|nr:histone-lysine N-methyltransferase SETMAR-like [Octopus bimaculoides]|eukprot:XP_014773958.1 PREDICTED: histone-lysine N-methyltransferase SETMAR-like [Octopus bimaculoides]
MEKEKNEDSANCCWVLENTMRSHQEVYKVFVNQCVAYKYEFCRGTNASQTTRNISEVFGENVANGRTVHRWFEKFRSGDFTLKSQPRARHEAKVDNNELQTVVEADTSQTTLE